MPLTPFHLVPAWVIFLSKPRRWSFTGLSVGSVIPDIEVPFLYITGWESRTGHGPLHSILGALTIDIMIIFLAVYLIYPSVAGLWEGKFGTKWIHFGGVNVGDIESFRQIALGAYVGVSFHIAMDYLTHTTMPFLWPFSGPTVTFSFAKEALWLLAVNLSLLAMLILLTWKYLGKMESTMITEYVSSGAGEELP